MTSSKVHKNVTRWKTFFRRLALWSHWHVVPYSCSIRHNFSTAFSPLRGKLPPKKNLLPLFSRKRLYFFGTFFHHHISFDWATNDSGLRVPRFAIWGWGQKQIFKRGEKLHVFHYKKSGNLVLLYILAYTRGSSPLHNTENLRKIGKRF